MVARNQNPQRRHEDAEKDPGKLTTEATEEIIERTRDKFHPDVIWGDEGEILFGSKKRD
jgi:hypothetical protein